MHEIDIWRAAAQMLKAHGEDAAIKAALRSDALLEMGDTEGARVWQQIVAAVNDLHRKRPLDGERCN
jgi:hypothetical protein